jgi:hypothetical protein
MVDEKMQIKPASLMLNDLELNPYQYHDEVNHRGSLRINARVILSESQYATLGKMTKVIDVVRVGIDEQPRKMLLDEVAWHKSDQQIKEEIRLHDYESKNELPLIPWLGGMAELVAKQSLIIDNLLGLLVLKGIIADENVNEIYSTITDECIRERKREYNRIDRKDLDEYDFKN